MLTLLTRECLAQGPWNDPVVAIELPCRWSPSCDGGVLVQRSSGSKWSHRNWVMHSLMIQTNLPIFKGFSCTTKQHEQLFERVWSSLWVIIVRCGPENDYAWVLSDANFGGSFSLGVFKLYVLMVLFVFQNKKNSWEVRRMVQILCEKPLQTNLFHKSVFSWSGKVFLFLYYIFPFLETFPNKCCVQFSKSLRQVNLCSVFQSFPLLETFPNDLWDKFISGALSTSHGGQVTFTVLPKRSRQPQLNQLGCQPVKQPFFLGIING